MNHST